MQTKQQIRQLLTSAGVRPNKRLGQHFLIDLNLMRLLINSANIQDNDVVLEVGCATGSLTEGLAQKAAKVIAVELDKTLADIAKKHLSKAENVEILNGDILKNKNTINQTIIKTLQASHKKNAGRILLVANLPYNVAAPVVLNLVKGPAIADWATLGFAPASAMYVTVQKEVAERMRAGPGSSDYGILSILLGATGEVKVIRIIKPTAFWPSPQVDSAMVSFVRQKEKVNKIKDMSLLAEIVKLFMNHRRKMLKSCIKSVAGKLDKINNWTEIFDNCSIDSTLRPEQLSPQDYVAIANQCCYKNV
ncbi:MAG: ribosomal RNA small subunit methyltransferase A [Planctomycetes bacterium RBG_13_46_10]|nr:MAG: ribosomal RNA small subunit methyltransferase A [Planctomycetes bacterium RBG_13_46_10]